MKVHIITTSVGEPQLPAQIAQIEEIKSQYHGLIEHSIISDLNALESARAFHDVASKSVSDLIIKFDADMTFDSVKNAIDLISRFACCGCSRVTFPVFDHVTGLNIYGCHFLKTADIPNQIYLSVTQRDDWIAKMEGRLESLGTLWLHHAACPTERQRFVFGFNRGLKLRHKRQNTSSTFWASILSSGFRSSTLLRGYLMGFDAVEPSFDHKKLLMASSQLNEKGFVLMLLKLIIFRPLSLLKGFLDYHKTANACRNVKKIMIQRALQ